MLSVLIALIPIEENVFIYQFSTPDFEDRIIKLSSKFGKI